MRSWIMAAAVTASLLGSPIYGDDSRNELPRGAVSHLLLDGEGLDSVAKLYGVTPQTLRSANPEADWSVGQAVLVPRPSRGWPTHTVRAGETLWRISKAYGITLEEIRQANSLTDNALMPGNVLTLPRAVKPVWSLPEPSVAAAATETVSSARPQAVYGTVAPRDSSKPLGAWVEVRLPDNRRAWVPASSLVVGSWQPQEPQKVLELGRAFMGVPYKWGGVDPNGWDCSGFVQEVFRLGGHQVPRLADAQFEACEKVELESLQPGDLLFFNTDGSGVSHVGIYTGGDRFLHASSSRGVVEDSFKEGYFATRYHGAGRIPAWQPDKAAMSPEQDAQE